MSTHNIINQLIAFFFSVCAWWGARAVRRGSIDNFYLSTGLSWSPGWPWGGGPGCGASLALGTSCVESSNSMQ